VLLSATLPLVGINMILGCVLAARDRQRQWAIAGVAAAVLNVSVNFVAIPYTQAHFDNGAIGAAAVTSLTEVMLLGAGLFLCPRGVFDSATVRFVLRCGLAALVMAVLIWPLRDGSVLLTVPFGALVFLVAAFATRAVSSDDVRALRAMLARRGELPVEPATL
jgi:O-antigen/teichoic acid export membrane protein